MFKKINIIIVFLSLILSLNLNIGYSVFLPVLIFYLFKDIKNIYYTYIPTIIVSIVFLKEYFVFTLCVLTMTVLFYFIQTSLLSDKIKLTIPNIIYISIINIIYLIICKETLIIKYIVLTLLTCLIYIYLEKNLFKLLLERNITFNSKIPSLIFIEILVCILAAVSASTITIYNVNLGVIFGVFFAMYFGKSYRNIYTFIYSVSVMLILYMFFGINESIFIPFTSALYIVSNSLISILYNLFLISIIFINNTYNDESLIAMMVISIVFELINKYITDEANSNDEIIKNIYESIQKNANEELMAFSVFLDKFTTAFKNPSEFNERLSDGIKLLVQNNCMKCPKKKECFDKYKKELYDIFKNILLQEPNFKINFPGFEEYCPQISSLEHTSKFLESKIKQPLLKNREHNNMLIAQLNGVSNTIKKYVIDMSCEEELNYYQVMLLKKRLEDYGYEITYFEAVKLFVDDFNIKVGLKGMKKEEIENTIKLITENTLLRKTSLVLDNVDHGNIYINIIPQLKIDITYGYGALSCDGEDICGDNYLIKEISNGHFISAISDGMGKGYRAFYESDTTLKLVEDIVKLNVSTTTALEILNSFYSVQEYLEEYATLDFLEINRYNETASFYKMGGATSYIFRQDGTIEKVFNKSLPFGLDDEIDNVKYELYDGDLILMSSDGIFENIIDETNLQEYIESIKNLPPQKIVYELLNYTIKSKIKTKDDMSIIALKIEKAA